MCTCARVCVCVWYASAQKKFGHWERYAKAFPDDTIDYEHMGHDKAVFMRWKVCTNG